MENVIIVGSGIAGMSAAYFLKDRYKVMLLERNDYFGGHTNTVNVYEGGQRVPIDTGFMVFNEVTYPNLVKMFKKLNVFCKDTDMSFSVKHLISGLEYNGSSMSGLFSQRKNIFNFSFWKLLLEINRFNKLAPKLLQQNNFHEISIRDFITQYGFSESFLNNFLIPMSSAVWSTPFQQMLDFPARTLIQFFFNHGFLGLDCQHQWRTVMNGSEQYKQKILSVLNGNYRKDASVLSVYREGVKWMVALVNGEVLTCDKVIFASHADETLSMIKSPSVLQKELLSKFKYQENVALLHTDSTVMPKERRAWSSWNYIIDNEKSGKTFTVYYMNMLQHVSEKVDYFVNINGEEHVDKSKILKRIVYHHPLFDVAAIEAQMRLQELNKVDDGMYFCGSYFKYGFHEDALTSSVVLCESILGEKVL
jgi:predicted NAD/FAD-binding protein